MSEPISFEDTITASLRAAANAPVEDDLDTEETLDNQETETQEDGEAVLEEGQEPGDQEPDETGSEDQDPAKQVHELTVNGETVEVTLDELKKGYLRQSDYTKKTQNLPKPEEIEELSSRASVADNIDARFNQDPELLISDFLLSYGEQDAQKVSAGLVEVIKTLAGSGALVPELANFFQFDEAALNYFQQNVRSRRGLSTKALALADQERQVQPLAQQRETEAYETQVLSTLDEVAASLNVPEKDMAAFREATFKYMIEEEMTDLKDAKRAARLAYKQYQLEQKEKAAAKPTPPKRSKSPVATPSRGGAPVPSTNQGSMADTILANLRKAQNS